MPKKHLSVCCAYACFIRGVGGVDMANVFDVAKYILNQTGEISTWKLQKLCYYSQAWELAWTGKPLFKEDFEAWTNGPVCRELYNDHKGRFYVREEHLHKGDINALNDEQKETIDIIIRDYGYMEPYQLREQTHAEAPWRDAHQGCPDGVPCKNVISKEAMGNYYGAL